MKKRTFLYRLCAFCLILGGISVPTQADAVISTDTSVSADYAYSGAVTINGGVTLDLNGHKLGSSDTSATCVTSMAGAGTVTNTSATNSLLTIRNSAGNDAFAPTITGNVSVAFSPAGDLITRLNNSANAWTGDTYIHGGRLHVTSGDCIGSGTIYLNGNLVNNSSGGVNLELNNNVVINGSDASIRAAYGGSITLNGVISGSGASNRLTIGKNESAANKYFIYGANTYSCDTYIGDPSYSALTQSITIADGKGFGTSGIYMISSANLTLGKTGTSYSSFAFANNIHLGGKTLAVTNSTGSNLTISSAVTNSTMNYGKISINGNGKNLTLTGSFTGNMSLSLTGKDSTVVTIGTTTFSGNVDLSFGNSGNTVYYRINNQNQNNTGDTTIIGGSNTRVHVSYGTALGSGTIYLDGNLCNNSQSKRRVTFDQNIKISGAGASFRVAYVGDDSYAYMRLKGVISSDAAHDSDYKLTFNAVESAPGMIFLYGQNTFTCGSEFSNANNINKLVLGTDSALGAASSKLTVSGSGRILLENNAADVTRTLSNAVQIAAGKSIRFESVKTTWADETGYGAYTLSAGQGEAIVASNITGTTTSTVYFGSETAANNTGLLTFSGTIGTSAALLNTQVAAGQNFAVDHAVFNGNLVCAPASSLYVDGGIQVSGDLTAPSRITLSLDDTVKNETLLDVGGTLVIRSDASIFVTASVPTNDPMNQVLLYSAASVQNENGVEYTTAQLLEMIDFSEALFPTDANWNYILSVTNAGIMLQADPNAIPEPSAWMLLVLGSVGLLLFRTKLNIPVGS